MKRSISILLSIFLLAGILSACAPAAPTSPAVSVEATSVALKVTDGLGRNLTLNPNPRRIISLAPSNTEILFAIGAGEMVVGRDDFSNYPEQVKSLPTVGGNMGDYNLEEIISLKPDLVLAAGINTPEQVKAIEDAGLPVVYYLSNPTDLEGMYKNLETVGLLTNRQKQADDLVASLRGRVDAVEQKLQGITTRPKVFYELDGSDPSKPWTSGKGTFMDLLIQMSGGENVGESMGTDWGQMSLEALIVANPDVILLGDANYGMTPEQVSARAGWDQIQGVKTGQILPFNDDMASRPGPRLVDALEILAKILHPDKFE